MAKTQHKMDAPSDNIETRVTRVESEIASIADTVGKLAEQQSRSHAETQAAIRQLATSTAEAFNDMRDRIASQRESRPGTTIAIVGLLWGASVVLVGWGASVSAKGAVNEAQIRSNTEDLASRVGHRFNMPDYERLIVPRLDRYEARLENITTAIEAHKGDGHARRVEQKADENTKELLWLRGLVLEMHGNRNTAESGYERDTVLRRHAERISKAESGLDSLKETVAHDKDDLDDLRHWIKESQNP